MPACFNALRIVSFVKFAGRFINLLSGSELMLIEVEVSPLTRYFPSSLIAKVEVYLLRSGLILTIFDPLPGFIRWTEMISPFGIPVCPGLVPSLDNKLL